MLNMHVNPQFNTLEHKLIRHANYARIRNLIYVEAANNPTMQATTKFLNFNKNFLVTNLGNNWLA
jgi:hypothetical protein